MDSTGTLAPHPSDWGTWWSISWWINIPTSSPLGFPNSSVGKESACNAGDPGSICWVGKIPWRRDRLPTPVFLSFPCGSTGKESACNVGETWVWSLGWEDPLEKGKATHSGILAWRIPWTIVHGVAKSWTWLSNFHFPSPLRKNNPEVHGSCILPRIPWELGSGPTSPQG